MENENTTNTGQSQSTDSPQTASAHQAPAEATPNPTADKKQKWYSKAIRYTEHISIVHLFEGAALIIAAVVATIYYGQLQQMILQTKLANEQANRSVIEDIGNAATTRRQLDYLQQQARAARDSVETTQKQFRLEQRPRMAITEYMLVDGETGQQIVHPTIGKPVFVTVRIKNIGHSLAIGVRLHYHLLFESQKSELRAEPRDKPNAALEDVIEPTESGIGKHFTVISAKDTFAQEGERVNPDNLLGWDGSGVNVFGRITYSDQYGKSYCLPYMEELFPSGDWANVTGFTKYNVSTGKVVHVFSVRELCPPKTSQ